MCRSFNGAFPKYIEVDEEFRLYHDLAEDHKRGLLLAFDESGREIEVVRVTQNHVSVRLKYLRQFQAGVGLHLAIYIDSVRYSHIPLDDVPADQKELVEVAGLVRWRRDVQPSRIAGFATFSRLLSKVILAPAAIDKAGIWPFELDRDQREVTFIVGVDEDGNEIEHTSDHDKLNNYFVDRSAAHYLTPVYFRREVLAKYFAEPERYSVSDGQLSCLNLWSCQIDQGKRAIGCELAVG